jgi:hypothetical protein
MVHGPTGKQVSGRNEGAAVTVANKRAGCAGPFSSPNEPRPGQDRGCQAQDAGQRVATATGSSRVANAGQAGRQVRGLVVLKLAGIGADEVGQRGWDRVGRHGHPSRVMIQ